MGGNKKKSCSHVHSIVTDGWRATGHAMITGGVRDETPGMQSDVDPNVSLYAVAVCEIEPLHSRAEPPATRSLGLACQPANLKGQTGLIC